MKKIITTYFEPFGRRNYNASKATVEGLDGQYIKVGLPVSWIDIDSKLNEIFMQNPDYLFLFGEAGMINTPRLELEAHNISKGKDNRGIEKDLEKILLGGEDALFTNFITDESFVLSHDAGSYLCNCSFYLSLSKTNNTKVIFIHVPAFNEDEEEKKKQSIEIANRMIQHLLEMN